jgi:uncharacterized protein
MLFAHQGVRNVFSTEAFVNENSIDTAVGGNEVAAPVKKLRGFAAMSKERQKEIASLGGKMAHQRGTAHQFDTEAAKAAGKKGGEASRKKRASAS